MGLANNFGLLCPGTHWEGWREPQGLWHTGTHMGWEAGAMILSDPPRVAAGGKGQSSGPQPSTPVGNGGHDKLSGSLEI